MGKPLPRMAMAGRMAEAVVRAARDEGLGLPRSDDAIPTAVEAARWEPPLPDRA
jgi:hypothetical protein